jgi:hypothetical protein
MFLGTIEGGFWMARRVCWNKGEEPMIPHDGLRSFFTIIAHRLPEVAISQAALTVFFLDPSNKEGLDLCSIGFLDLVIVVTCWTVHMVDLKVIHLVIMNQFMLEHILK